MANWRILYLVLTILTGCEKKEPPILSPINVVTYVVESKTMPVSLDFVGVAKSSHLVEIRARIEGYLTKIDYTEGAFVKPGDLLFEIDPRQFIASVDEAKGELEKRKALLWAAQQAVARYRPLYEQKAASKRDLDNAVAEELADEAMVIEATASLEKAELNLSYTAITSPIAGLSGRAAFREGTLITPSVNGLLTYVTIVDPIWVIFSVSDSYLLKNQKERANSTLVYPENNNFDISLILSDGSEFPYSGKIDFTSPILDADTGTMTLRAVFPNPNHELLPGQFVRARVQGAKRPNAIAIPQQAVQQGDQGMYVYIVNKEDKVEIRFVTPGDWQNDLWFINSGLQAGERVIVEGVNKVHAGSLVKEVQ